MKSKTLLTKDWRDLVTWYAKIILALPTFPIRSTWPTEDLQDEYQSDGGDTKLTMLRAKTLGKGKMKLSSCVNRCVWGTLDTDENNDHI